MSGHEDKGKRYTGLLDAARVNGSWSEFPELIRKVTKHAPQRKLLIQTATAEHFVASYASRRPQTAPHSSETCIETLRQIAGSSEKPSSEEIFQGQTCLAWAAWTGVTQRGVEPIPVSDVVALFDTYGQRSASAWTKICLVKRILITGHTHGQTGEQTQVIALYRPVVAWVELNIDSVKSIPQLSYWSEQILASYGTLQSSAISDDARLQALQLWSSLVAKTQDISPLTFGNTNANIPRSSVWEIYYHKTSQALTQRPQDVTQSRTKLAIELRVIEAAYESNLLRKREFPTATESNDVIEDWVEGVIQNWQTLCGPAWSEDDLGPGGRNAVTRNVLDILYRAATKTFHSTLILRRLFQVHKALTEFELAYRCLDTYIELVDRARERAAKAGIPSPEPEETMVLVISEGVEGLCAFGRQKEAKKAFDLAIKLENWLEQIMPEEENDMPNGHVGSEELAMSPSQPSEHALQTVCRAIGIAKAHWARWTPFNETRSELQSEALAVIHKASRLSEPTLPTLYALALLYAETRDISRALRTTKTALQIVTKSASRSTPSEQCAFWHLLTLLLSSQQDFETALQSSTATVDSILSSGLVVQDNGSTDKSWRAHAADDLECDDLQKITELQITHLSLIELLDGPEAALNHSGELLGTYAKLFKRYEIGDIKVPAERNFVPPKRSAGTVKSIKGSIFSRRKATPSIAPSATTTSLRSAAQAEKQPRPGTQASHAPTIQVTDETGKHSSKKHHHLIHRHHDHGDRSSKRASKEPRPTTPATIKESPGATQQVSCTTGDGPEISTGGSDVLDHAASSSHQHDADTAAKQTLGVMEHKLTTHDKAASPLDHADQPPEQNVGLPNIGSHTTSTSPIPRFAKAAAQKHALVVLSKLWLTISKLYRRSHMFEDAREACEEASKAAARIETLVSTNDPTARALAGAGWGGGGKSSDEVWAEVYCSRAELLQAIVQRRQEEGTLTTCESLREVVEQYEQCLMYYPNHASGTVGLSNILLDYYDKKIDLAKKVDDGRSFGLRPAAKQFKEDDLLGSTTPSQEHLQDPFSSASLFGEDLRKTPENLNRIAARDRAYGLLDTLTKLGIGWDNSEAWFALARAYELGGEIDRAKKILWWCIDLEDTRPIRHWSNLGCGGYVL